MGFLRTQSIGIDISDRSIEIVFFEKKGSTFHCIQKERFLLEEGIIEHGRIVQKKEIATLLDTALTEMNIDRSIKCTFGIPSSQVYIHTFQLDAEHKENIGDIIQSHIQKIVPIDSADIIFDYRLIGKRRAKPEAITITIAKHILQQWHQLFVDIGFEHIVFDVESLAAYRALSKKNERCISIVDIGAKTTEVTLFDLDEPRYTRTIHKAGEYITQTIAQKTSLPVEKVEKDKTHIDLTKKKGKDTLALQEAVSDILADVKQTIEFFERTRGVEVEKIFFIGGSVQFSGFLPFAKKILTKDVGIGTNTFVDAPLEYLEACGLALLPLDKKFSRRFPFFVFEGEPSKHSNQKEIEKKGSIYKDVEIQELKDNVKTDETHLKKRTTQTKKLSFYRHIMVLALLLFCVVAGLTVWLIFLERSARVEHNSVQEVAMEVDVNNEEQTDAKEKSIVDGQEKMEIQEPKEPVRIFDDENNESQVQENTIRISQTNGELIPVYTTRVGTSTIDIEVEEGEEFVLLEGNREDFRVHIQIDEIVSGWVDTAYVRFTQE